MDRESAKDILKNAAIEYEVARKEREFQERRAEGLQLMIDGIVRMYPDLAEEARNATVQIPEDRPTPKGSDSVARVLQDRPGKWFSIPMIVHELERREWLPSGSGNPTNATRAAAERLLADTRFRKDRGEKTGQVVYSFRPEWQSEGYPPYHAQLGMSEDMTRMLSGEDAPGQ